MLILHSPPAAAHTHQSYFPAAKSTAEADFDAFIELFVTIWAIEDKDIPHLLYQHEKVMDLPPKLRVKHSLMYRNHDDPDMFAIQGLLMKHHANDSAQTWAKDMTTISHHMNLPIDTFTAESPEVHALMQKAEHMRDPKNRPAVKETATKAHDTPHTGPVPRLGLHALVLQHLQHYLKTAMWPMFESFNRAQGTRLASGIRPIPVIRAYNLAHVLCLLFRMRLRAFACEDGLFGERQDRTMGRVFLGLLTITMTDSIGFNRGHIINELATAFIDSKDLSWTTTELHHMHRWVLDALEHRVAYTTCDMKEFVHALEGYLSERKQTSVAMTTFIERYKIQLVQDERAHHRGDGVLRPPHARDTATTYLQYEVNHVAE